MRLARPTRSSAPCVLSTFSVRSLYRITDFSSDRRTQTDSFGRLLSSPSCPRSSTFFKSSEARSEERSTITTRDDHVSLRLKVQHDQFCVVLPRERYLGMQATAPHPQLGFGDVIRGDKRTVATASIVSVGEAQENKK